jgi:hypothetical protein
MSRICALAFCFLFIFHCIYLQAQERPVKSLEATFHFGSIIPHCDFMREFMDGPLVAGEIKMGFQTIGEKPWEQLYGYPRYGLGYYWGTLGNKKVLGLPMGIYSFFDIPLVRKSRFSLNNQLALGLSFGFHTYDPVENPLNLAIGSNINVFFYYNINTGIWITDRLRLNQGANFTHFSNGAVKMPNTGFYILNYYAGLQWVIDKEIPAYIYHILPPFRGNNQFFFLLASGIKQVEYKQEYYPMATLSAGYYRQIGRINKLGGGIDLFYDASLERNNPEGLPFHWLLRQGFFVGHELLIDNFSLVVQQGMYGYRKMNLHQKYYSRLGIKYHFKPGLFLSISLKAHWGKADYIEWGMGYLLGGRNKDNDNL